jgi:hypothetical protein
MISTSTMLSGLVALHPQFGMSPTGPVKVEEIDGGRGIPVHDDLHQHGSQDSLLQLHLGSPCTHVLPECAEQLCGATRVEAEGGLRNSTMGLKPVLESSDERRHRVQFFGGH